MFSQRDVKYELRGGRSKVVWSALRAGWGMQGWSKDKRISCSQANCFLVQYARIIAMMGCPTQHEVCSRISGLSMIMDDVALSSSRQPVP
jgi:hypothetical protein